MIPCGDEKPSSFAERYTSLKCVVDSSLFISVILIFSVSLKISSNYYTYLKIDTFEEMKTYLVQIALKVISYIIKTKCSKEINVDNAYLRSKLIYLHAI